MRAVLKPSDYCSPEIFASERTQLFRNAWLFVCLRPELGDEGDYIRVQVAGHDLILRNSKGTLRAFANVCSHRHSRLCAQDKGHGAIRCPYHGWVYNGEGVPVGIPCKEQFPQVVSDPNSFKLTEFTVDTAGDFVFVQLSESGLKLADYLGAHAFHFLLRVSEAQEHTLDAFERNVPANWKVVIENSLEGYHVPMVHSRTLGASDGMAAGFDAVLENFDSPRHSYMTKQAESEWLKKWTRKSRQTGTVPFQFDHYIHYLLFPNLTITSFLGLSFHVQRFDPIDHQTTKVHSRILASRFAGQTEMGRRMMEHVHNDGIAFTHQVFFEDEGVCSAVQAGLQQSSRHAVLAGDFERRILHFQNAWVAAQRGDN